jgi:hypothetical protein
MRPQTVTVFMIKMKTLSKTHTFLTILLGASFCLLLLQTADRSSPIASAATTGKHASRAIPGAGTYYAAFGKEASEAEREIVYAILKENFKARAAAEFAKQCKTLSARAIKHAEEEIAFLGPPEGCAGALKTEAEPLSRSAEARANNLSGPIAALRVKGRSAFALYFAKDGKPNAMPLRKEDGKWKVDALVSIDISAEG